MADATQVLDFDLDFGVSEDGRDGSSDRPIVAYIDLIPSIDGRITESYPLTIGRNLIGRATIEQIEPDEDDETQQPNCIQIDQPSVSFRHAEIILQEYQQQRGTSTPLPTNVIPIGKDGVLLDLNLIQVIDQKSTNWTCVADSLAVLQPQDKRRDEFRCPSRIPRLIKHNQYLSFGAAIVRFRVLGLDTPPPPVDAETTQAYGLVQEDATIPYGDVEPEKTIAYGGPDDLYGSTDGSAEREESIPAPSPAAPAAAAAPTSAPRQPPNAEATQAYACDEDEKSTDVAAVDTGDATQAFHGAPGEDDPVDDGGATQAYIPVSTFEATLAYPVSPTFSATPSSSTRPSPAKGERPEQTKPAATPTHAAAAAPAAEEVEAAATLAYEPEDEEPDAIDQPDPRRLIDNRVPASKPPSVAPSSPPQPSPHPVSSPTPSLPAPSPPSAHGQPTNDEDGSDGVDGPGASHSTLPPGSVHGSLSLPSTISQSAAPASASKLPSPPASGLATASLPREDETTLSYIPAEHVSGPPSVPTPDELQLTLDVDMTQEVTPPPVTHAAAPPPAPATAPTSAAPTAPKKDADGDVDMADVSGDAAADALAPIRSSSNLSTASAASATIPAWNRRKRGDATAESGVSPSPASSPPQSAHAAPAEAGSKPLSAQELKQQKFAAKAAEKARKDAERKAKGSVATSIQETMVDHTMASKGDGAHDDANETEEILQPVPIIRRMTRSAPTTGEKEIETDTKIAGNDEEPGDKAVDPTESAAASSSVSRSKSTAASRRRKVTTDEADPPLESPPAPSAVAARSTRRTGTPPRPPPVSPTPIDADATATATAAPVEESPPSVDRRATRRGRSSQQGTDSQPTVEAKGDVEPDSDPTRVVRRGRSSVGTTVEETPSKSAESPSIDPPPPPPPPAAAVPPVEAAPLVEPLRRMRSSRASPSPVSVEISEPATPIVVDSKPLPTPPPIAVARSASSSRGRKRGAAAMSRLADEEDGRGEQTKKDESALDPISEDAQDEPPTKRGKKATATKPASPEKSNGTADVPVVAASSRMTRRGTSPLIVEPIGVTAVTPPTNIDVEVKEKESESTPAAAKRTSSRRGRAASEAEAEEEVKPPQSMTESSAMEVDDSPAPLPPAASSAPVESKRRGRPTKASIAAAAAAAAAAASSSASVDVPPAASSSSSSSVVTPVPAPAPIVSVTPAPAATPPKATARGKRKQQATATAAAAQEDALAEEVAEVHQPEPVKPTSAKKARGAAKSSATAPAAPAAAAPAASSLSESASVVPVVPLTRPPQLVITGVNASIVIGPNVMSDVEHLNGSIIEDVNRATHLLTDQVRRTEKFLTAYSICQHILHYDWLIDSLAKGKFQDEECYRLKDASAEERFGFALSDRTTSTKFLDGWSVYVTPSVKPPPAAMTNIIRSAGGAVLTKAPTTLHDHTIIVGSSEDDKIQQKLHKIGYTIHTNEIILTGVLRQKLQLDEPAHLLTAAPSAPAPATAGRAKRK